MMKILSDLGSRTTPQTSPLRASDGESFVSYTMKNYRDISSAKLYHSGAAIDWLTTFDLTVSI